MNREPDIDLGFPLEPFIRRHPRAFAGRVLAAFVCACYVLGAIFDNGVI